MSRYRMARTVLKDNSASKSVDHDQYFTQSEESMPTIGNKVTSLRNRPNGVKVHCTKSSPLYFNLRQPTIDVPESKILGRQNVRERMVFENPLLFRSYIADSVHTSLSSLEISSNQQQPEVYE